MIMMIIMIIMVGMLGMISRMVVAHTVPLPNTFHRNDKDLIPRSSGQGHFTHHRYLHVMVRIGFIHRFVAMAVGRYKGCADLQRYPSTGNCLGDGLKVASLSQTIRQIATKATVEPRTGYPW